MNELNSNKVFEFSFKTNLIQSQELGKKKEVFAIIVDDEFLIRNAMKRLITTQLKDNPNLEINIIEANDGIECIFAMYLANLNKIKINFIITDENMNYINGTNASEIIKNIIKNGKFGDVPIFMSTANLKNLTVAKPDIIKKVFSKPMDKKSMHELMASCDIGIK